MSKIHNYDNFLNEEFFRKIFKKDKKTQQNSKIDSCVEEILNFLNENGIYTWDDFLYSKKVDKYIINKIIDSSTKNMKELEEVRFKLRLELSSRQQLKEYLKDLEANEEFDWNEILKDNRKPEEVDKWSELEKDLSEVVNKYEGKFGPDSYGVVDAMYQVLDGMFQKK